ncbi:MAG: hypothetical protein RL492_489 [Verrucomicrobiota bacterium]|jgi:hypothetical protein
MSTCDRVEELEGPYGPFAIGERAIQRLWAAGEVTGPMATVSGRTVEVLAPGDWNRGAGPDFLGAELRLDERRVRGDVEIHLRSSDWQAHQHDRDPNFSGVVLHAVLLPGTKDVTTAAGHQPETVVLLPYLPRDLEDLAEEDALLELRGRAGEVASKVQAAEGVLLPGLRRRALERFRRKAKHAKARAKAIGWDAACHELVVESLGHGGNRAAMSELARAHSPEEMVLLGLDALYMEKCGRWRLRGLRPAGHPYRRLAQYLELNRRQPTWREQVRLWGADLGHAVLTSHRRRLHDGILGCVFPDGRADTLCINALLPLLHASGQDCERTWSDWPPGNHPEDIDQARRLLGLAGSSRNFEVQGILDVIRRSVPTTPLA